MFSHALVRPNCRPLILAICLAFSLASPVAALDSFRSIDNRLPEPNHPYDMTNGPVLFGAYPVALYDLQFHPTDPSQVDVPKLNADGNWQFDSSFKIAYKAIISQGLGPAYPVSGFGTAHATGLAPGGSFTQVFDTELVSLNLFGLSLIPELMFRESPTSKSTGITTRENLCPMCASIVSYWRISSYFDVFAEFSLNGGSTWLPANKAIHIEQVGNPAKLVDFNGDGMVDAADFLAWRQSNGIGYDYDLWRTYFGMASTNAPANVMTGSVPEPSMCLLALAAALSLQSLVGGIVRQHSRLHPPD
jgi:hypothetical protein